MSVQTAPLRVGAVCRGRLNTVKHNPIPFQKTITNGYKLPLNTDTNTAYNIRNLIMKIMNRYPYPLSHGLRQGSPRQRLRRFQARTIRIQKILPQTCARISVWHKQIRDSVKEIQNCQC